MTLTTAEVEEAVKQLVAEEFELPFVDPDSNIMEDLGADSLEVVELVQAIEELFDLEITDQDAEKLHTVQDVVNYVARRTGAE